MHLFPKNPKFFEMFGELTKALSSISDILRKMKVGGKTLVSQAQKIRTLELHVDSICHKLIAEAEVAFITPFDREDIHALSKQLDDVTDLLEDLATKYVLYNGRMRATKESAAFSNLIGDQIHATCSLVMLLQHQDAYRVKMKKCISEIRDLEHQGDELFRKVTRLLFTKERNAVTIIKWKDLYETMERITDTCEDVADTVEVVMMKNF